MTSSDDSGGVRVVAIWDASALVPTDTPIGWASDRSRRHLSMLIVAVGVIVGVVLFAVGPPALAALVLALAFGVGVWLNLSGTSGFYELDGGGVPTTFLGRVGLDLAGRSRRRP